MNLLSTLLPGIRELRAPLAAGYIWLTIAWLALRTSLTNSDVLRSLANDLRPVLTIGGRTGAIAAFTFCAYLVGLLSIGVSSKVLILESRYRGPRPKKDPFARDPVVSGDYMKQLEECGLEETEIKSYIDNFYDMGRRAASRRMPRDIAMSTQGIESLRELITARLSQRLSTISESDAAPIADELSKNEIKLPQPVMDCLWNARPSESRGGKRYVVIDNLISARNGSQLLAQNLYSLNSSGLEDSRRRAIVRDTIDIDYYVPSILDSIRDVPNRLLGLDVELYSMYDRYRTEAEFRTGVALPLLFLVASLPAGVPFWWRIAIAACAIALNTSGTNRLRLSGDTLAEALRAGREIHVPAVDELASAPLIFRHPLRMKPSILPGVPYR